MSEGFDSERACPMTKNAWCAGDDCPFYNSELAQCSLWRRTEGYEELAGSITGAQNDKELDLGQVFKDATIWVDKACILQLGAIGESNINMTVASGRVGTPVVFTDIWIRKVYITTTETTSYIITGNG